MSKNEYTAIPTAAPVRSKPKSKSWVVPIVVLFTLAAVLGTGIAGCRKHMGQDMSMSIHKPLAGVGAAIQALDATPQMPSVWDYVPVTALPSLKAEAEEGACPKQPDARAVGDAWDPAADAAYAKLAAGRLSAAVQIQTVSFDDMPDDAADPRFDGHYELAKWMEHEYPTVYGALAHEMVNTHGHLFTWKGKAQGGKPILLMAHADVVPVNPDTVDQWSYPPWDGEITHDAEGAPGVWIWGRGASDCKNSLTGILAAVEKLVQDGYTPERDVLIAYGFDEEIGGARGAMHIARVIEERYGKNGVAFIVDEGFSGIEDSYGARLATLGMAEKGSVSVRIQVDTPGGHSSVPPPHTGIGLISRLLTVLEDHPYKPSLVPQSPFLKYLSCLAEYAPHFPEKIAKRVRNPKAWPKLAVDLAAKERVVNSFLATSTAIDLIHGGVKVNALPEVVEATVNHRISFTSSVNETLQHYVNLLLPVTKKLGLTSTFFGEQHGKSAHHVTVEIIGTEHKHGLEPAPITPSDSAPFAFIGGTIRAVFGKETIITPTGMFANTDTARTWALTEHIYRFTPAALNESLNMHTVNERISVNAHLTTIQFYHRLIRNLEGWDGEMQSQ